jgi:fibro-slime domain-containing protein
LGAAALLLALGACGDVADTRDAGGRAQDAGDGGRDAGDGARDGGQDSGTVKLVGCKADGLPVQQFDASSKAADVEFDAIAKDLKADTLAGAFSLAASWSGCDSYVVVLNWPEQADSAAFWSSAIEPLIDDSPANTHYLFVSMRAADAGAATRSDVKALSDRIKAYLGGKPKAAQKDWASRLHYVVTPGEKLGWLGALALRAGPKTRLLGIDRAERVREGGSASVVIGVAWQPQLSNARYLAQSFNYEATLNARLAQDQDDPDARVVVLADAQDVEPATVLAVDLPKASELSRYDVLELELRAQCPGAVGHPYATECGAWDTVGFIDVCADADCSGVTHEIFRWITPYANVGHWAQDISPMLPYFQAGGKVYLRIRNEYAYKYTLALHLRDDGKGMLPRVAQTLFEPVHVRFDATYNEEYRPVVLTPPPGTTRAVLFGIITGHGAGDAQCAEFCTHQHRLTVNGTKFDKTYEIKSGADGQDGCARRVSEGVTPNQGGTWFYDRAAWCPGWRVEPWVQDITDALDLKGENTLTWESFFNGGPPSGNGAVIDASLQIVFYGKDTLAPVDITPQPAEPACRASTPVTVRDFHSDHPDFALGDLPMAGQGVKTGAVAIKLLDVGGEWKPVYAWADKPDKRKDGPDPVPFTNADNFAQWFTDVPDVNVTRQVKLPWLKTAAGTALLEQWDYYPLAPTDGFGVEGDGDQNRDSTTEIATRFTYRGGEVLRFSSESDLWVFVNHRLALDLGGGVHDFLDRQIDFDKRASEFLIVKGTTYDIHIFAADRNANSRLTLELPDTCN